eukprot:TRINITY_DN13164_c0_g2_i1.p1 TRINITY_DN13164_c0_g2~~TRINITY_DN13164_c0_g2_i1.p1  ORF type:complete len:131 (-),score=17.22 TRINITY_DN13164_c0_g2_i1:81-473(-)
MRSVKESIQEWGICEEDISRVLNCMLLLQWPSLNSKLLHLPSQSKIRTCTKGHQKTGGKDSRKTALELRATFQVSYAMQTSAKEFLEIGGKNVGSATTSPRHLQGCVLFASSPQESRCSSDRSNLECQIR